MPFRIDLSTPPTFHDAITVNLNVSHSSLNTYHGFFYHATIVLLHLLCVFLFVMYGSIVRVKSIFHAYFNIF